MAILWPLDSVEVTGQWANSPWYYNQFGQAGHNGIDLAASIGTPVYATDEGWIVAEGWGNYDNWMGSIAGIFVRVGHSWGYSAYAHLSTTIVDVGQWVNRGQLVGYSGATGVGTGPHLHFETFPLYPNFGNGFAGRVNPATYGLEYRGSSNSASKPAEKPTPAPAKKSWEDTMYKFEYGNKRKTAQQVPAGKFTALSYFDNHGDASTGNVTIVRGPGDVVGLVVNVTMKGTPGKRVDLQLQRETGEEKNRKRIGRVRGTFDSLGMFSTQLSYSGALSRGQLVRVYAQVENGAAETEVTEFYWSGYARSA